MSNWYRQMSEIVANLFRLRPYIGAKPWLVVAVIFCATLSALFEMVGIGLLVPLIALFQNKPEDYLTGQYLGQIPKMFPGRGSSFFVWLFATLVISAIAAKNILFVIYQRLQARFGRDVSTNLRDALYKRLQSASLHVFEQRPAGEMLSAYTTETIRTQGAVDFLLLFIQRSLLALFYLCGLVYVSWEFSLGILCLMVIVAGISLLFFRKLKLHGDQRSNLQRELFGFIGGVLAGMRVIRATRAEAQSYHRFSKLNRDLGEAEIKGTFYSSLMSPATELLAVSGAVLLLALTNMWLIQPGRLHPSNLMGIGVVLIRLLPLLNQLYAITGQLVYYGAGVRELLRWLGVPLFPSRPFGNTTFERVQNQVRIEGLGFTFPNGKVALSDINLTIPAGKTVALVGSSGSGKTTLASLLLRLREPSTGRILIDGADYWDFTADSWHRRLGMVEQEAFLFNESIRNNITVGCPQCTPAEVEHAIRVAHLGDVIAQLPAGLDSVVGERGTMLSGGQKQRLAIARAMVRDPQLLILDEATSALDNVSEREVQAALDEARSGRTSVVIAHRLSTIRNADIIVVLEHGRIVEQGTWDSLEKSSGRFSALLAAASKVSTAGAS
jgi:ATP-binding cassette, subfamily B, bacterial MsbA